MFTGGHFSVLVAGLIGGCSGWPISDDTDRQDWNVVNSGKRGWSGREGQPCGQLWETRMVRAGGSASRIIGDQGTTDPSGGDGGSRRGQRAWQLPVGRGLGHSWASNTHAFPPLGSQGYIQSFSIQMREQLKRRRPICPPI